MSELVNFLTKYLDEKKISQSDFSRLSGIPRQVINYYLEGKVKSPSDNYLRKIAKATGQSEEFIFSLVGKLRDKNITDPSVDELINKISSLSDENQGLVKNFVSMLHKMQNEK